MISQLRLPRLLHRTLLRDQLTILMYHAVIQTPLEVDNWCFISADSFMSQVKYLKEHFEVIHLSEAFERMRNESLHRPTAVITFDDGFQNNYDVAFPILREVGLPATIFLTTGLINSDDTVWFCRLNGALAHSSKPSFEWNGSRYDLLGPEAKAATAAAIQGKLKALPNDQLLVKLREIVLELGDDPDRPIDSNSPYRMLDHEAIVEMAASGLIEYGAHTQTHAILSRISPEESYQEITQSVSAVHELTGRPCKLFAYPNGGTQDYDAESIRALEVCGIQVAVTTIEGSNDTRTPCMELRRYGIGPNLSITDFQQKVHHYWSLESTRLQSQAYGPLVFEALDKSRACKHVLRRFSRALINQ